MSDETAFLMVSALFFGPGLFCLAVGSLGIVAWVMKLPPFDEVG